MREDRQKILLITPCFPPANSAGVFRTLRFVRYLPEWGWHVHVLTVDPACYRPGVGVDEQLMAKVQADVGVHTTRAVYPLDWADRLKRFLGSRNGQGASVGIERRRPDTSNTQLSTLNPQTLSWQWLKDAVTAPFMTPDRDVGWVPFAVRAGKRIIRDKGIEFLYTSAPPWSTHLVGLRLKRSSGLPWVADFRDPWVGSDFKSWRRSNSWVGRKHQKLEREVVETADRVIANTPRSCEDLLGRYPELPAEKFLVIPNGFDPADYEDLSLSGVSTQQDGLPPARLILAHAGTFYGKRNVNGLIDACGLLAQQDGAWRERIEVRLIGGERPGRSAERDRIAARNVGAMVKLSPRVSHSECLQKLSEAHVLLLVQVGAPLSVPGKAFEYMALRKPIFGLAGDGATSDLICGEDLGVCLDPEDVEGIAAALKRLYAKLSTRQGLEPLPSDAVRRYDGCHLTERLHGVLSELVDRSSADPSTETAEPVLTGDKHR